MASGEWSTLHSPLSTRYRGAGRGSISVSSLGGMAAGPDGSGLGVADERGCNLGVMPVAPGTACGSSWTNAAGGGTLQCDQSGGSGHGRQHVWK